MKLQGKPRGIIDLKGIHFSRKMPKRLNLWKDCSLAWQSPVAGVASYGFGVRTRPQLLLAARKYAQSQRLQMVVIHIAGRPLTLPDETPWGELSQRALGFVN